MCYLFSYVSLKFILFTQILLAPNLFGHFGLENSNFNEYDTDIMLEYEDSDTYKDFKEFFFDILPEFQKFGQVVEIKVSFDQYYIYKFDIIY